ncbi:hypothetical protein ACQUW5_05775 [Legionella sp. CNM-1927-20]|uniref:hypothetical protein n=1 Tax=Legionella sp. CNM-1927-20 TaxID=3422221 RepID=UPI00403AA60C
MRRSLSELICDDLEELAYFGSEVVASEEAIRFLMTMYRTKNALGDVDLVHKTQFLSVLKSILQANEAYIKSERNPAIFNNKASRFKQYQFLIEVGNRSQSQQRQPDTVHYCAVDLFIISGERPVAFVADHYRGHDGYYYEFQQVARELNIFFIIAGNSVYQADRVHCPIFSLYHLLLTFRDNDFISNFLLNIAKNNTRSDHVLINWNKLPPDYLLLSQSVSMLWKYIDTVKVNEQTSDALPSKVLAQAFFDRKLSIGLYADRHEQGKIRNRNIKLTASKMAGEAVIILEQNRGEFSSESVLINICYRARYPLVHKVLMEALTISNEYSQMLDNSVNADSKPHPLFELTFFYAGVVENCLKNKNFASILNNRSVLIALQLNWINLTELFNTLTQLNKERKVNQENCNIIFNNLNGFTKIIERLLIDHANPCKGLLKLLISPRMKAFFKDESLSDLFKKGLISVESIELIQPYQIDRNYYDRLKNDSDKIAYLHDVFFVQPNDVSNSNLSQDYEDFSIFDVPEPTVVSEVKSLEKPDLNIALLAHSMGKSLFNNTQAGVIEENNDDSRLQLVTSIHN